MKTTRNLKNATGIIAMMLLSLSIQSFTNPDKKDRKAPLITSKVEFLKFENGQYLFQMSFTKSAELPENRGINVSIEANNGVEIFNEQYTGRTKNILFRIDEASIESLVFMVGSSRDNLHEFTANRSYKEETWFSKL